MEFDEVKKYYYEVLKKLSTGTGKSVEELDKEISDQLKECQNVEDIMIKASELFDE